MNLRASAPLELWGGVECTVNRVGDRYSDQLVLTGHETRADDLDRFAALGLQAIRYPLLWERIAPERPDDCDWRWSDARLGRLRALGIRPIAGLVHHGSGPRYTDLLDPDFPAKLADYAARVAARYEWIEDWTPVNEPLTTARFSALYGHWYPHVRDERLFWQALLNQVAGVRAAMRAIRRVRPDARLIQTDDLGRSFSTRACAAQARFDNARRWAGWDLLFGRITHDHPLWRRLCRLGLEDALHAAADDPCPPDIVGLNHYLTSDRFLDHRVGRYPAESRGGNGRRRYADVAAVRVIEPPPEGVGLALSEAWARYRTPLALTEVHVGCTREEQLRFAAESWDAAHAARRRGIDVRAVTAWSLLGSHSWNTLLTAPGVYEPGIFDVRGPKPHPTALAPLWAGLPHGATRHPSARTPGWWRRPERLLHPPVRSRHGLRPPRPIAPDTPLLVIAAEGAVKQAFTAAAMLRGLWLVFDRTPAAPWGVITVRAVDRVRQAAGPSPGGLIELRLPGETIQPELLGRLIADAIDQAVDATAETFC